MINKLLSVGAAIALAPFQRHLLFPSSKSNLVMDSPFHRIRKVGVPVNGSILQGYLAEPIGGKDDHTRGLVFVHGRKEHPTSIFHALEHLQSHVVFAFHHRGLGLQIRKPTEEQLFAACCDAFKWFEASTGFNKNRITVVGRSLGSSLATRLVGVVRPSSLVLISPFDMLLTAVREVVPGCPAWILKDEHNARLAMRDVECPCLLIVGERDTTVTPRISRSLFLGWRGQYSEYSVPDLGHNGLLKKDGVHKAIADFIGKSGNQAAR